MTLSNCLCFKLNAIFKTLGTDHPARTYVHNHQFIVYSTILNKMYAYIVELCIIYIPNKQSESEIYILATILAN